METNQKLQKTDWVRIIGIGLLITGATLFIEVQLKTGWLFYLPLLALAAVATIRGIRDKKNLFIISGLVLFAAVIILFVTIGFKQISVIHKLAISAFTLCAVWLLYSILYYLQSHEYPYWTLIITGLLFGLGLSFAWRDSQFIDFVLWIGLGLSVPMLIWGFSKKYFGLIIAGCIIFSSGAGVYIAWADTNAEINSLARTGIMLVTFALGWGGISVFSKRIFPTIAWWPLIPAGVLSMSGWGLFIGGNPGVSSEYFGNTISLALIILGVYVLLLRSGFNKKN